MEPVLVQQEEKELASYSMGLYSQFPNLQQLRMFQGTLYRATNLLCLSQVAIAIAKSQFLTET